MTSALNEKWWQVRYRFRFFYSEVNNIDEVYKYMLKVKFYFLILTTSRFMDTSTTDGSRWWFLKALFATTGESLDSRRQLKACSQYILCAAFFKYYDGTSTFSWTTYRREGSKKIVALRGATTTVASCSLYSLRICEKLAKSRRSRLPMLPD